MVSTDVGIHLGIHTPLWMQVEEKEEREVEEEEVVVVVVRPSS